MNIVFYLLLIVALIVLWAFLACIFKPIGKYLYKLFKDIRDTMTDCDEENIKEEKEN